MHWQRLLLREIPREPISLIAGISAVASLASGAVGAIGAINQGKAAQSAADYNAALAERNATIAKNEAVNREASLRNQNARKLATAAAGFGASGLQMEGTPLDVMEETARVGELDALTTRWQGDVRQDEYKSNAQLERMRGAAAKQSSYTGAAGALLSGVSSAAGAFRGGSLSLK